MVATIRCRKYNTIDGRKDRSVDWFGREARNSLRSCGLFETLLFYVYVNCAIANLIDISGLSMKIRVCSFLSKLSQPCFHHNFIIIRSPVVKK